MKWIYASSKARSDGDMQAAKRAYNAPPLSQYMVMWAAGRFKSYVR